MARVERRAKVNGVLVVVTTLVLVLVSSSAGAYEYHETESGKKIRWHKDEVKIVLDSSLARLGPLDEVEQVIAEAFEDWMELANLPTEFVLVPGECDEPGYSDKGKNENCVMAIHGYAGKSDDVGATALVSHKSQSGKIVDGDIVFNLDAGSWTTTGEPGALDLGTVALHEIGHLIGLAHSEVEGAVMFPLLDEETADTLDTLHTDDIDGAVALYGDLASDLGLASCDGRCVAATGTPRGWSLFTLVACGLVLWTRRRSGLARKRGSR